MDKKFFLFLVILSVFLLVECGRRHKHRHHKHRHCPSRDDVDHVCCEWEYHSYLMTYQTCTKCKGNDPQDSSQTCKPWRRRPHCLYYYTVNVTTVSCQPKCCEGWTEDEYGDCTISTDDEQQITCENGGTPAGDSCNCPIGFVGVRCEKAVCTPPCLNNGMCSGKDGQPVCVCPEGRFTGPQCETPVCDPACKNGGSCVAGAYSSYCTCPSGYEGDSCENKVKDGDCPSPTGAGICAETCSSDSDCHGEQKCCRNGCGARVCMAAAKDTCYLNGTEYPVGHLMKRDPCTMCFCKDPNSYDPWECVSTSCPRLTCTHTKMIPNKCCAVCDVTTTTPAPTTRVPTTTTKTTTTTTTTPAPTTRLPATTTKTTTTTTQMLYDGCFENGVKYPLGHVINKNNNCDTCTCIYPQYYLLPDWQCKRVDCPSYLNCRNFTQIPGQCCPVCNDFTTTTLARTILPSRTLRPSINVSPQLSTVTFTTVGPKQVNTTKTPFTSTFKAKQTSCFFGGEYYSNGFKRIMEDNCQECICGYEQSQVWTCTSISCSTLTCEYQRNIEGLCCPVCDDTRLTKLPTSPYTTQHITSHRTSTKESSQQPPVYHNKTTVSTRRPTSTQTPSTSNQMKEMMCSHNGIYFLIGDTRPGHEMCEICTCNLTTINYLEWQCGRIGCPKLDCKVQMATGDQCCPVCYHDVPTTKTPPTTTQPTTHRPATQRPTTPSTQRPTTQKPSTQRPTTQKPPTERPTTQRPTTSQPTTQTPKRTCTYNNNEYSIGYIRSGNNKCETCICMYIYNQYPEWSCTGCPRLDCGHQKRVEGQCCPVCYDSSTSTPRPTTPKPVCHHDGIEYPPYHTLKKTDCETCYCNYLDTGGLDWNCMVMDCAPTSCTNYITVPGQCCPICPETPKPASTTMAPSCVYNNTKYPHMSVIRQEPCQICTCRYLYGGYLGWNCVTGRCNATTTTPPSPTTYKPVCHHNGVEYPLYSRLNRSDCEICTCNYVSRGVDWSCMIIDCLRPQCENFYSIPGQCCPVCPDTTPRPTTARPTTQRPPLHEGPLFKTCPSEQIIVHTHQERIVHIRSQVNLTVTDKSGRLYTITYSKETIEAVACSCSSNIHIITAQSEPDRYGRFASCVFTVKVVDNHPPMFSTCPSNFAAFEDEVISWDEPKATDNVGIKETQFISELPNKSIFPKGHHALVYIATDHEGNVGACRFLISIYSRDTTDPSAPLEIKNAGDDHDKGILINIIIGVLAALIILTIAIIMSVCFYRYKKQVRQRHEQASSAAAYDNGIYATPRTPPPSYSQASVKKLPPKYMLNDEKPPLYEELDVKVFSKKGVQNPIYDSSDELDVRDIRLKLRMREHTDA